MKDLKQYKPNTPEYWRARYENVRELYDGRLAIIKVARYLTHGDLPTERAVALALGISVNKLRPRLARRDVPDEVADYCGVPSLYLRNRSALTRWVRGNL